MFFYIWEIYGKKRIEQFWRTALYRKGGVASMTFFNISVNNGVSRFYFCMYTHLML